jgi:hypothetical protein
VMEVWQIVWGGREASGGVPPRPEGRVYTP